MERTRHPRPPGDRAPDQHEALAAERKRQADERDALADQREQQQDDRERAQDRREAAAEERKREADKRERELDERAQTLGTAFANLEQRMLETIQRSRALLAASSHRFDREAEAKPAARRERDETETGRVATESRKREAPRLPDPSKPIERAQALRSQALAAIAAFAATEEEIARIHDELATRHPARRDEHRQLAEHARRTARKAHETLRAFTD